VDEVVDPTIYPAGDIALAQAVLRLDSLLFVLNDHYGA
jgi:hypothetical protein